MYNIGIDIGGMSFKGGIVDQKGNIVYKEVVATVPNASADKNADDLAELILILIRNSKLDVAQIASIGIGFPGTTDSDKGIVVHTPNISFEKYPIKKALKQRLNNDFPIYISNDANCAALGESLFGKQKIDNAVLITLGTGVGSGIIVDGKIFEGYKSMGAEGGHIRIKSGGEKCGCGNRGCFEAYASASALIRQTKLAIEKNPQSILAQVAQKEGEVCGKTVFIADRQGCKVAKSVIRRYTKYVGDGIISILNLFGSEYIIIGGGISKEGDYFIKPLSRYINRYKYGSKFYPKTKVIPASLHNDAGIVGAAFIGQSKN